MIGSTADSDCILVYIRAYVCMYVSSHHWCTSLSILDIRIVFSIRINSFRLIFTVIVDWHLQEFYKIVILYMNIFMRSCIWYFPILWLKPILICFYATSSPKFSFTSSVQNSMCFYVLVLKCCHHLFIVVFLLQVKLPTVSLPVDVLQPAGFSFLYISACYLVPFKYL